MIDTLINPADPPEKQAQKLLTIAQVLMRRVEQITDDSGTAYAQFQRAAMLEDQVRERTRDLERALDLLNQSNAQLAEANRATEAARQNLANAIETIQEGFALFDAQDVLVMCNSRFGMHMLDVRDHLKPGLRFGDYVDRVSRSRFLELPAGESPEDWAIARRRRHQDQHVIFNVRMVWDRWVQVSEHRTADGGNAWTLLSATPNFAAPQAWYDLSVGVDPTNPNRVFCGGVSPLYATAGVIESINGGQTWTEISGSGGQIHPDQHAIAFGADNTPWFGCDGGVWRRVGGTWSNRNATLAAIQNYTIHEHPNDANRVMTGTQDNGMAGTATGSLVWPQLTAGDGGYGVYLNEVYTTLFTTYVYLRVYRKTGNTTTDISGPWSNDSREWIAPLVADLNGGTTIYGGSNRVWRNLSSLSGGSANWTAISDTSVADGGTLTAIATVAGSPGVIWVGNSSGGVWRSTDAGATWTRARTNDGTRIAAISARPRDPLTAVIVRNASSGVRVLRTLNALNWTSLTGTMPSGVTAKALAVDWDRGVPTLFVGSGAGVYTSFNSGAAWTKSGPDLPNVNIGQLEINRARRTIAVGTYGRGAWRSILPRPADIDANGLVDGGDLAILLDSWGACTTPLQCGADIDGSGLIDGGDLTLLLSSWGS
ncbi:MAG: hypothetical protein RL354_1997 [Planctomycetota bacterium]